MFCCSCLVFLLWILPVPKLAHLWNSQPCKSCQMYWMVVLALCTICHQGGTQRTSSSASSCHHGFTTVSRQCRCIFPLGWTTPASHPLHWELSSQPSWLKSHPIHFSQFPFHSPLAMLLAAMVIQTSGCSVIKLFCPCPFPCSEKLWANFGSKTSLPAFVRLQI